MIKCPNAKLPKKDSNPSILSLTLAISGGDDPGLAAVDLALTCYFVVEVAARIVALTPPVFFARWYNVVDLVVVVSTFILAVSSQVRNVAVVAAAAVSNVIAAVAAGVSDLLLLLCRMLLLLLLLLFPATVAVSATLVAAFATAVAVYATLYL